MWKKWNTLKKSAKKENKHVPKTGQLPEIGKLISINWKTKQIISFNETSTLNQHKGQKLWLFFTNILIFITLKNAPLDSYKWLF